jgi:hypothetical protein
MELKKKERLQSRGWKVGTAADFLDLPPEEALLIDVKARQQTQKELLSELSDHALALPADAADSIALLRNDRSR